MNSPEREALIERLVEIDGGDEGRRARSRAFYSKFSDAELPSLLESAEQALRDIARYGSRLHAIWADTRGLILTTAEQEAAERAAAGDEEPEEEEPDYDDDDDEEPGA